VLYNEIAVLHWTITTRAVDSCYLNWLTSGWESSFLPFILSLLYPAGLCKGQDSTGLSSSPLEETHLEVNHHLKKMPPKSLFLKCVCATQWDNLFDWTVQSFCSHHGPHQGIEWEGNVYQVIGTDVFGVLRSHQACEHGEEPENMNVLEKST
jgi:hypothetical protein